LKERYDGAMKNRTVILYNSLPPDIGFVRNNPVFCTRQPIDVLFYVVSSAGNFVQRQTIRNNWGKPSTVNGHRYKTLFFVGLTTPDVQQKLDREVQEHGDVIQMDVVDSYTNLTLKVTAAIGWMSTYCSHIDYVVKADDDVVFDFDYFDHLLTGQVITELPSRKIVCTFYPHAYPYTDPTSKFYIPNNKMTLYPPYCDGGFYGYPASLLPEMQRIISNTPMFAMEDIYVTGIVLPQTQTTSHSLTYIDIRSVFMYVTKAHLHNNASPLMNHFIFANVHDPDTFEKVSTHIRRRRNNVSQ